MRNTKTRVMPEGNHAAISPISPAGVKPGDAPVAAARALPAVYPLDDFYARAGVALPNVEVVPPESVPEPFRTLLVHANDMTPTLAAFHASTIGLRVLSREQRGEFYFREVVLVAEGTAAPVEFGAIRINLSLFAPKARQHILEERSPLGHLLGVHAVTHSSRPKAFFRLESDALMARALALAQPAVLYGRRNTLLDAVKRPLAEVVEILPPAR